MGSLADDLKEENKLYKYRTTIQSLSQTFKQIKRQSKAKLKECFPWTLIVSNQFSGLRVLHIQYLKDQRKYSQRWYSIDAFELFKFINGNTQLELVTVKGVFIFNMQRFVKTLWLKNSQQNFQENEQNSWLKALRPWINLRLILHSEYQLHPYIGFNQKSTAQTSAFRLSALSYFQKLFKQLSGMAVVFKYNGVNWEGRFKKLLQYQRSITQIKIIIDSVYSIVLLKQLLNDLSSFTKITSLSFYHIKLSADFSAVQKSLSVLFEYNNIAHLKLLNCDNFPAFPYITTLQSIQINRVSFWGNYDLGKLIKTNRLMKVIDIRSMEKQYRWEIEQDIFDQLQCLSVDITNNGISFEKISSLSLSRLKYLTMQNINRINANVLKPMLPKLANLIQITLMQFDFGYQLLSAIPSNQLEELSIWGNNQITDSDLQLIDCKWPYLREIQLLKCPQISERIFLLCKFKGLMKILIDDEILSLQVRKYLRGRGIAF